jgi:hypothetical protein
MYCRKVIPVLLAAATLAGCETYYAARRDIGLDPVDPPRPQAQSARTTPRPAATAAAPKPKEVKAPIKVTVAPSTNTTPEAQREAELQREMVAQNWLAERRRLIVVGNRIMRANTELCGQYLAPDIGLYLINSESMGTGEYIPALAQAGNLDSRHYVFVVPEGSPVEAAGLRERDRLITVDGWHIPDGRAGAVQLGERLGKRQPLLPMPVVFERDGATFSAEITPKISCSGMFDLVQRTAPSAAANGRQVAVTTGMMRFASSDDELAIVLGHEIAHNILRHSRQFGDGLRQDAAAVRRGEDATQLIGRRFQYLQQHEREADYYGLYLTHRAGYTVAAAPGFWRRMAIENPGGIEGSLTHPTTADRVVGIENTLAEIAARQMANQPLRPSIDGETVTVAGPPAAAGSPAIQPTAVASTTAVTSAATPVAVAMPVPPPPPAPTAATADKTAPAEDPALALAATTQASWTAQRTAMLALSKQGNTRPVDYREPEPPAPVVEAAATPASPASAARAAPPPAARPGAQVATAAARAGTANPAAMTPAAAPGLPAGYRPSASVVDQPGMAAEQQKVAAATGAQPTPPEMAGRMAAGAGPAAAGWKAHLASHRTESAAINEWQELLKANTGLYGQFDPLVEWTDTPRGPFARLVLVGFAERKDADAACAKLRSSTRYCASVKD